MRELKKLLYEIAMLAKSLSNKERVYILALLYAAKMIPDAEGGLSFTELNSILKLNPKTIQEHLRLLEKTKLIEKIYKKRDSLIQGKGRKTSRSIYCLTDFGEEKLFTIFKIERECMLDVAALLYEYLSAYDLEREEKGIGKGTLYL